MNVLIHDCIYLYDEMNLLVKDDELLIKPIKYILTHEYPYFQ